jgi:CDP-6-deoxy-D-xylo-4-hexulose-3-dehydrase
MADMNSQSPQASDTRAKVFDAVREYFSVSEPPKQFIPGKSVVPVSGRVCDVEGMLSLVDASLDMWLTAGRFADAFEKELAERVGLSHALLVNSGSSANLLAVSALTAPELEKRCLEQGDEVVIVAASFPTTVNPILLYGAVPVFVDVELGTYNARIEEIEAAIGPRTKAIFLAHTRGTHFIWSRSSAWRKSIVSGLLRIAATLWDRPIEDAPSQPSVTSAHSVFTRPITSPWERAARWPPRAPG